MKSPHEDKKPIVINNKTGAIFQWIFSITSRGLCAKAADNICGLGSFFRNI